MGKYGRAATLAAERVKRSDGITPVEAWRSAVRDVFPRSPESQKKGCPRDAFLGLCAMGVVNGVQPGAYTSSEKNRAYVARALKALRSDPALAGSKSGLWRIAVDGEEKAENKQMDVLVTLWEEGWVQ